MLGLCILPFWNLTNLRVTSSSKNMESLISCSWCIAHQKKLFFFFMIEHCPLLRTYLFVLVLESMWNWFKYTDLKSEVFIVVNAQIVDIGLWHCIMWLGGYQCFRFGFDTNDRGTVCPECWYLSARIHSVTIKAHVFLCKYFIYFKLFLKHWELCWCVTNETCWHVRHVKYVVLPVGMEVDMF